MEVVGTCKMSGCNKETVNRSSYCQEHYDVIYDKLSKRANEDQIKEEADIEKPKSFEVDPINLYKKVKETVNNKIVDSDYIIPYYCQHIIKLMSYQVPEDKAIEFVMAVRKTVTDEIISNLFTRTGERYDRLEKPSHIFNQEER